MKKVELKPGERLDDLLIDDRKIIQNGEFYTFTSDSILLAKFSEVKKKDVVIDLCSGCGIIGLHIAATAELKKMYQVELQAELADMAARSVAMNGLSGKIEVLNRKLQGVSQIIGVEKADVIVCNPPYERYYDVKVASKNESDRLAKFEVELGIEELVFEVEKLLKYNGSLYMCLPAERTSEACYVLSQRKIEPKILEFVFEDKATQARLVLIKAVKGGRRGVLVKKHA